MIESSNPMGYFIPGAIINSRLTAIPHDICSNREGANYMNRKALIMYASMTGNTGKVAEAFKEIFNQYGFKTDIYVADGKRLSEKQIYFEDYDFVCIGSGLYGGVPSKSLSKLLALHGPDAGIFYRKGAGWEHANRGEDRKGLAFITYGGSFYGPDETEAGMAQIRLWLNEHGIHCVGEFTCPGREVNTFKMNKLGEYLGSNMFEAIKVFDRYIVNPDSDEFRNPELKALLEDAAKINEHGEQKPAPMNYTLADGSEVSGSWSYHHHLMARPDERDLTKAKLLLSDILEDYYLTGDGTPNRSRSCYKSIS